MVNASAIWAGLKIAANAVTKFGYNATVDKGRRQAPAKRVKHESKELTLPARKKLNATALDTARNHAVAAWMIRQHLDYVSRFHVSIRTESDPINTLLNRILHWHGAPQNFDVAGRLGRDESFRMYENEKVVLGDAGLIKLPGLKLQGLESDLIAKGSDNPFAIVNNFGLIVDQATGRREQFSVCNRGDSGNKVIFDHLERAENIIYDGYWTRLVSQYRGVSPLSAAINSIQDIAEGCEFNQVKLKMHALFGMAIFRGAPAGGEFGGAGGATAETASAAATAADTELDLNPRAINILDLNQEDKVEILESGTPSNEFVEGTRLFVQIAMLALDIPFSFFDSQKSSFAAMIADQNKYEVSVEWKRTKNRYVRQQYSDWLLAEIYKDTASPWGLKAAADTAKFSLRDLQEAVQWIAAGSPWLDKLKQIMGDKMAIETGLDNRIDAAARKGGNYFKNIDKEKKAIEYANKQGVPLQFAGSGQKTIEELIADSVIAANEANAELGDNATEE